MTIKLAILGEPGIGKTAIVDILAVGEVTGEANIYDRVEVKVKNSLQSVDIEIHDVSGLDQYQILQDQAVEECHGVILVYSPQVAGSMLQLKKWHELSQSRKKKPCVCLAYNRPFRVARYNGVVRRNTQGALPEMPQFAVNYSERSKRSKLEEDFYKIASFVLANSSEVQDDSGPDKAAPVKAAPVKAAPVKAAPDDFDSGKSDSESTVFDVEAWNSDGSAITDYEDSDGSATGYGD